ncbi:hypothetical protein CK203_019620 [Vitis vinifera]|uniref:Uncharacterized protein n=1 Tax=Vitis vinifera TaxID=29760 RepID=A0A438JR03_VITVI|nr:hypothetical protein CK203_019620 [Vitis vinifera]
MLRMETLTTQVGGIIQFFMEAKSTLVPTTAQPSQQASSLEQAIVNLSKIMDGMQNDLSQKIDNLQYSISRLTNLNTVQENGRFPSQPHQNPKGIKKLSHQHPSHMLREEEEETKKREEIKGKKKDISEGKEDHDSTVNANPEKELVKEEMMKKTHFHLFLKLCMGKRG